MWRLDLALAKTLTGCRASLAIAGLLVVGGCESGTTTGSPTTGAAPSSAGGQDVLVGDSVTGEECRLVDLGARSKGARVAEFKVRCAGWEEPSGEAWLFTVGPDVSLEALMSGEDLPIGGRNPDSCGQLEPSTTVDNEPLLLQHCQSADGWPLLLVGKKIQRDGETKIALGFGFTHLAPVFEQWFAVVAGKRQAGARVVGTSTQFTRLAELELSPGGSLLTLDDIRLQQELVKIATVYNHAGDFSNAEGAHRRALDIQERFLAPDDPAIGVAKAAIALNLSDQSKFAEADTLFSSAETQIGKGTRVQRARFLAYRGQHLAHLTRTEEGVRMIRSSRSLLRDFAGDESPEVAYSHFLEGSILGRNGDQGRAIRSLETALGIFDRRKDPVWIAFTKERLGDAYRRLGNGERARTLFVEAEPPMLATFGEGFRYAQLLAKMAASERALGRNQEAIAHYRRSIETARSDAVASEHLDIEDVAPYLDLLLDTAQDPSTSLELALDAIQAPSDQATGTAIRLMAARLAVVDPRVRDLVKALQDTIDERQAARLDLARERYREDEERDAALLKTLEAKEKEATAKVKRYEAELQATTPRYGQLVAAKPLGTERIAALLTPGEALIRVMPTDKALYVILVDHNGRVRGHKANVSLTQLSGMVSALRETLDLEGVSALKPFDHALAHDLYRAIFGPINAELAGLRHLIYVPSGPLLSLPPALLVRKPPAGDTTDWLIRHVGISILPTINALEQLRTIAGRSTARHAFLGIGDPVLRGEASLSAMEDDCARIGKFDPARLQELVPLPETRDELMQISASLGPSSDNLLLGGVASETTLRSRRDFSDYRIVAFATHALLSRQLDCLSEPALVLTPPDRASEIDDGLLTSSDIAQLRFDADWILLSACNTGGPEGKFGGQSLTGLTRAFFYAGARALMVSHWTIESETTVSLTTNTFGAYAEGSIGKAEALRRAQLAMIDAPTAPNALETSHPALWAGFTLVGDGGQNEL